jgi:hypothetical protein
MQDAPCPLRDSPTRLAGHQLAQREPRPVPEKWHSVSQLPVVGGDEIYAGFTGPGVTRLITRNPANSVNVARQMRAAAAAHPAGDKARVVVIAVAAPVAGVIDRIALLKRSAPDAEAAPACNWDNQAHLRRIKRYRPCRE